MVDLAPLQGLTGLKALRVDGNDVRDFAPLAALEARGLVVYGKHRQLGNYVKTRFFELCRSAATGAPARRTIEAILWTTMSEDCATANERLLGLTSLRLADRGLSDLTPLADLEGLTELDLSGNALFDLTPLAGLENLNRLDVTGSQAVDLKPLAPLLARGLIVKGAATP